MVENYLTIGAYHKRYNTGPALISSFVFYCGYNLPSIMEEANLIQVIKVPKKLETVLLNNLKNQHTKLGYIKYDINGSSASSIHYFPRDEVPQIRGYGLGSLLELVATNNLKKMGITYIKSTSRASVTRSKLVYKKMGLETGRKYDIHTWMKGVGKAIRTARHLK